MPRKNKEDNQFTSFSLEHRAPHQRCARLLGLSQASRVKLSRVVHVSRHVQWSKSMAVHFILRCCSAAFVFPAESERDALASSRRWL